MNARIYDITIGCGLLCVASGAYLVFGLGPALLIVGGTTIALTVFAAVMGGAR
jgi:hypothetical protein